MIDSIDHWNLVSAKKLNLNRIASYRMAEKALVASREIQYTQGEALALNNQGNYYAYLGEYSKAFDCYFSVLKLSEGNESLQEVKAKSLSNIGNVYFFLDHPNKTIQYNKKAYHIFNQNDDIQGIANCLKNIGNVYFHNGTHDSASIYYHKALNHYRKTDDTTGYAGILHNIALIQRKERSYEEEEETYNKSLSLYKSIGDSGGISLVKTNLAHLYIRQKKYSEAEQILQDALSLIKNAGLTERKKDIYRLYSRLHRKQKNYKCALSYFKKYSQLRDSIIKNNNQRKIQQLETSYKLEQVRKENKLKETRLRKKNFIIKIITISSIICLIALILVIYLLDRLRRKTNKIARLNKIIMKKHREIVSGRNAYYEQQLKEKQQELTAKALFLSKAKEQNNRIVDELKKITTKLQLPQKTLIMNLIKKNKSLTSTDHLKEFELQYKELNTHFYERLIRKFPDLTPKERRLCILLKLNMTSKEIASITLTSEESVNVARSRLRNKLGVPKEINLVDFMAEI